MLIFDSCENRVSFKCFLFSFAMEESENEIYARLAKEFNEKYGKDLLDLEKCQEIRLEYQNKLKRLELELSLSNDDSKIVKTVLKTENDLKEADNVLKKTELITSDIKQFLQENEDIKTELQEKINKLNELECTLQYFKVLQYTNNLSAQLHKEIIIKNDEQCAIIFANLCEVYRTLLEIPPTNLLNKLKELVHHWHNVLKEKFAKDFEEVLKALKWPFVSANFSLQTPSSSYIIKLQTLTEYLLQIELPNENPYPVVTSALLSDFPPVCLPVYYLTVPLRKRFVYHFYGNRQTNRVDKPEWYFTQILSWIRDHKDYIKKWIQPIVDKLGMHHIDAEVEFMRGLTQIAVEKLNSDLPTIQYDDFTFSHTIDEALSFNKELTDNYNYPTSQPSILAVLTQAQVFQKWLAMERKYAMEKMDVMLSTSSSDTFSLLPSETGEDAKIPACADLFVTLLQTISERYVCLSQPGHRLQFLELQLDLLDDFRVRLLQIVHAESGGKIIESRIPLIGNALHYIENVLVDWGAMLQYLNLYYYKTQLQEKNGGIQEQIQFNDDFDAPLDTDNVFADVLCLYRNMCSDLLCMLAEAVSEEIIRKSKSYCDERWNVMPVNKDLRSLYLTQSACPMFETLGTRLHQLERRLTNRLFAVVWRQIAKTLDEYIYENLVLENRFNDGGAQQFKYDVSRNLLPLFAQFCDKPEVYFVNLVESSNLLTVSKGSALLLRETLVALEGATGVEDIRGKALAEVGVTKFGPKEALNVLNRRTDITTNRISVD